MSENSLDTSESNLAVIVNRVMTGDKALSYSSLKSFLQSPRHYKSYVLNNIEQTKAMKEGIIFHVACLEPEKFEREYWVLDDADIIKEIGGAKPKSTKAYKEWVSEQCELNEGKMINKDDYDVFMNMSKSLRLNSATKWMFDNMVSAEQKYNYEYDNFNITIKLDGEGETDEFRYLFDIKKVADASFDKIRWDIKRMKYHMQGGMYSNLRGIEHYYLIYIDKGCNITVVKLTKETLDEGFAMFEGALDNFTLCAEQDLWNSSYEFYNKGFINF